MRWEKRVVRHRWEWSRTEANRRVSGRPLSNGGRKRAANDDSKFKMTHEYSREKTSACLTFVWFWRMHLSKLSLANPRCIRVQHALDMKYLGFWLYFHLWTNIIQAIWFIVYEYEWINDICSCEIYISLGYQRCNPLWVLQDITSITICRSLSWLFFSKVS